MAAIEEAAKKQSQEAKVHAQAEEGRKRKLLPPPSSASSSEKPHRIIDLTDDMPLLAAKAGTEDDIETIFDSMVPSLLTKMVALFRDEIARHNMVVVPSTQHTNKSSSTVRRPSANRSSAPAGMTLNRTSNAATDTFPSTDTTAPDAAPLDDKIMENSEFAAIINEALELIKRRAVDYAASQNEKRKKQCLPTGDGLGVDGIDLGGGDGLYRKQRFVWKEVENVSHRRR